MKLINKNLENLKTNLRWIEQSINFNEPSNKLLIQKILNSIDEIKELELKLKDFQNEYNDNECYKKDAIYYENKYYESETQDE